MSLLPGAGLQRGSPESISAPVERSDYRLLPGLPLLRCCGPRISSLGSPGTKGRSQRRRGGGGAADGSRGESAQLRAELRGYLVVRPRGQVRLGSARQLQAQAVALRSVSAPGAQ